MKRSRKAVMIFFEPRPQGNALALPLTGPPFPMHGGVYRGALATFYPPLCLSLAIPFDAFKSPLLPALISCDLINPICDAACIVPYTNRIKNKSSFNTTRAKHSIEPMVQHNANQCIRWYNSKAQYPL